ncbi:MAG TPA: hypothetical protein VFZ29_11425 [Solirubrobacterales bacterium]
MDSQIGAVTIRGNHEGDPDYELGKAAVRLLTPQSDKLARLGFVVPTLEAPVEMSVAASPESEHGLKLAIESLPATSPLQSLDLDIWGIPADPIHDEERFPISPGGLPASQPRMPFTRSPTSCKAVSVLTVKVDSHQDPGNFASASGAAPLIAGCGKLAFPATLEAGLTSTEAETPAGLDFTVAIPADLSPNGLSTSDAEEIFIALPPQLALDEGSLESASSLGSFAATVLGTEATLEGEIHFDSAESAGSYRLLLIGAGGGIDLELPAFLEYDEATDSWVLALPAMPQLPLEELEIHLTSASGPFAASVCGSFEASSELSPWSGRSPRLAVHELTIDSGPEGGPCPVPEQEPDPPSPSPAAVTPSPPPPAVALQPAPQPIVKLRRRPPSQTTDRTPTFRFSANVAGSSFECKIDGRPLRRCKSPLTLSRLSYGRHVFKVRAVSPQGVKSRFAVYGFLIRR